MIILKYNILKYFKKVYFVFVCERDRQKQRERGSERKCLPQRQKESREWERRGWKLKTW